MSESITGPHISLAAEPVFSLGQLILTNAMLTSIVGSVVIIAVFVLGARRVTVNPSGRLSLMIETISESILGLIEDVTGNRTKAAQYFPLLMTLFAFILINNWLGLLPGVGSIVVHTPHGTVPLLRGATADLNTTLGLALISVIMTHIYAIRELGLFTHLQKYLSWNPVLLFVGALEILADISKMISFAFRLFGNIFAGEVLLVIMAYLAPVAGPLPFFALELFVGLVQALVFTMLTLVFLQIASAHHGEGSAAHQTNH